MKFEVNGSTRQSHAGRLLQLLSRIGIVHLAERGPPVSDSCEYPFRESWFNMRGFLLFSSRRLLWGAVARRKREVVHVVCCEGLIVIHGSRL